MEMKVGDQFLTYKQVTENNIKLSADLSGVHNPLHLDADLARARWT